MAPPDLVLRAEALAQSLGFGNSCTPDVGRLLHVLAATVRSGQVGEFGTGCGVGTAWMASALTPQASLVTVDLDAERAAAANHLFASCPNVRCLHADWTGLLPHGPFDLLFVDAAPPKREHPDRALQALRIGGIAVLDDLTPLDRWPDDWRGRPDPVRDFWLHDRRLAAAEVMLTPTMAVILATRVA